MIPFLEGFVRSQYVIIEAARTPGAEPVERPTMPARLGRKLVEWGEQLQGGAEPPKAASESDEAYRSRLRRYSSGLPAQFAIELPPGSLDRLGIAVEQRIELDLDRLKAVASAADQR